MTNAYDHSDLSQEQQEHIEELRAAVQAQDELSDNEKHWADQANSYRRYLVAHKWNPTIALEKLLATLEWRRTYKPESISIEDVWEEAQEKIIYTNGKDKEGRPIMVFKKRGTLHDPAMQLRLFVFMLEEAIRRMDHGIYQFVLILDMQELASANSPPLPSTLELLRTLSGHYPERMKIAFFTHQPFVFTVLYNLVYPFLDQRQRNKLNFLGSSNFVKLQDWIDDDQLERKYGGTSDFDFDPSVFLKTP
ncbi:hypothetical protein HDU91_003205 [Kappamyces sp. JEL0680]|nr:hypothetical protein HDU91_003205 [Kappamyces sp. JEL0680]